MHVPDGFLDVQTSVATGVVAATAVGLALRRSRAELDERAAPLAGLTAAFIFAVQMLNFPVGVGTSGHLMGGALAAALVGPWTAVLCVSVVLVVQALLFADGGLTALGTNITLMAVVTVAVGWAVTKLVLSVAARPPRLRGASGGDGCAAVGAGGRGGFPRSLRVGWRSEPAHRRSDREHAGLAHTDRDRRGHHHRSHGRGRRCRSA